MAFSEDLTYFPKEHSVREQNLQSKETNYHSPQQMTPALSLVPVTKAAKHSLDQSAPKSMIETQLGREMRVLPQQLDSNGSRAEDSW